MKIVFNGDSITDARWRDDVDMYLGIGFPFMLKAMLQEHYLDEDVEVYNRAVSGDIIEGLDSRFTKDIEEIGGDTPDVVSILIGINDTGYNEKKDTFGTPGEFERFEQKYRSILDQAVALKIPNIVVAEPWVVSDADIDRYYWRKDLDPKIQIVRRLAKEYGAIDISLDGILNQVSQNYGWQKVMRDGVHPAPLGYKIFADRWYEAVVPELDKYRANQK